MKSLFTKALVYSIGTIVVSAAVFSITMAGLNLAGKTDVTKQVIEEMDEVLGIQSINLEPIKKLLNIGAPEAVDVFILQLKLKPNFLDNL